MSHSHSVAISLDFLHFSFSYVLEANKTTLTGYACKISSIHNNQQAQTVYYCSVKSLEFSNIQWWCLILQLSGDGCCIIIFSNLKSIIKRTCTVAVECDSLVRKREKVRLVCGLPFFIISCSVFTSVNVEISFLLKHENQDTFLYSHYTLHTVYILTKSLVDWLHFVPCFHHRFSFRS